MKKEFLTDVICGLLILLFVYTASSKWLALDSFTGALQTAPLIRPYAPVLAWVVPAVEIFVSLLLLLPRQRLLGLYASLGLLLFFTLYLSLVLLFSPHLPCSCGGVINRLSWPEHLLFNLFFIGINCIGIRLSKTSFPSQLLYNQA